jgi:hypothetical protein
MASRSDAARERGARMREKNRTKCDRFATIFAKAFGITEHVQHHIDTGTKNALGKAFVKITDQLPPPKNKAENKRVKKEVTPEKEDDKKIHPDVWLMFDAARDLVRVNDPDGILALYWLNEYMNDVIGTVTPTPEIFKTMFPLEIYERRGEMCCALVVIEKVYRIGVLKRDINDVGFWK